MKRERTQRLDYSGERMYDIYRERGREGREKGRGGGVKKRRDTWSIDIRKLLCRDCYRILSRPIHEFKLQPQEKTKRESQIEERELNEKKKEHAKTDHSPA